MTILGQVKQVNDKSILIIIGMLFLLAPFGFAQEVKKDTSYTVNSAYQKYLKQFPFIKVAQVDASNITIQQNIAYSYTDTRELQLDIYRPKAQKKSLPVVFMIHGGGWKSGDKSHMQALGSELSNQGYVAIAMEYRLSPEAVYPVGVEDVTASIKWAIMHSPKLKIDTTKMVVLGCSSGAQMASLVGMTAKERVLDIKAVVNLDGILAFHHSESREGAAAALWLGGTFEEAKDNWEEASPLTHAGNDDPAILFVNSQYPRFHAGRDDMITILNREGIYAEIHEFPDTPHTFWLFDPWFDPAVDVILNFIEKML